MAILTVNTFPGIRNCKLNNKLPESVYIQGIGDFFMQTFLFQPSITVFRNIYNMPYVIVFSVHKILLPMLSFQSKSPAAFENHQALTRLFITGILVIVFTVTHYIETILGYKQQNSIRIELLAR